MSLNKVTLLGRLTRDPELKYTPSSGAAVARYSLAVERNFGKQGEKKEVDFFNIVVWNKPAEFAAQYFKKGRMVVVVGRLQTNKWTDKDGQNKSTVEIVAEEQYFADSKQSEQQNTQQNSNEDEVDFDLEKGINDQDLPF